MTKKLYCLVGASGTGKSTILNYIRLHFNITVMEVSARPFLPTDTDYVNGLTTDSQVLITQNRFTSFIEHAVKGETIFFSRSPIDSLAYEKTLKKAPFLENLLNRQIEVTKHLIEYIYLPIEFNMEESEDVVRGTNKEVQELTDFHIKDILKQP